MYTGKIVFSQVIAHMPSHTFQRCAQRYFGNWQVKHFACLDQFPVKLHTQLDLRGNTPTFIQISNGQISDGKIARLYLLTQCGAFFVTRAKSNLRPLTFTT